MAEPTPEMIERLEAFVGDSGWMLDGPLAHLCAAFAQSEIARARQEAMEERDKLLDALRQKDAAMGVLFDRLAKAGVDCNDLIPWRLLKAS